MMAQNGLVVAGIDIAKDKADVSIRAMSQRQTFPSTAQGRRQLIPWLRKHKVTKAVMEASGGYERGWARALRGKDIEVHIVDPKRVGQDGGGHRPDLGPAPRKLSEIPNFSRGRAVGRIAVNGKETLRLSRGMSAN